MPVFIRESVDSLCRDGAEILKQMPYNFTTITLKAYLSAQASSLSTFVISKTHIVTQKGEAKFTVIHVAVTSSYYNGIV